MVRCPVCDAVQIAYLEAPLKTHCYYCGAHWVQKGHEQSGVTESKPLRTARREATLDPPPDPARRGSVPNETVPLGTPPAALGV